MSTALPAPFVVGVARSGTTLLRLMLDAHPALAIPPETYFLLPLFRQPKPLDELGPAEFCRLVTGFHTWSDLGVAAPDLETALAALPRFSVAEGVRAVYRLYAERHRKRLWGDKTPAYGRHAAAIARLLPEARFVHIVRDGRAVAASLRSLWFAPAEDAAGLARHWRDEITAIRGQAAGLPYLEIRYEDLVHEPVATLARVVAFIDLEPHPAMLDYHRTALARLGEVGDQHLPDGRTVTRESRLAKHRWLGEPPAPSRIDDWRSRLGPAEQRAFAAEAGPLLDELDYGA